MTKIKKPKKQNTKFALFFLFIATFIISLFIGGTFLKNFSPPVDVNIGGKEETEVPEENEVFADVDSRLKWIQDEDNFGESQSEETIRPDYTPEIKTANVQTQKSSNTKEKKQVNPIKNYGSDDNVRFSFDDAPIPVASPTVKTKQIQNPPKPTISEIPVKNTESVGLTQSMTKVYIGFYPTMEQANTIKNRVSSAIVGYQPFVRKMGNQYVVQIAAFVDRDRAISLRTELDNKGFSARLLTE